MIVKTLLHFFLLVLSLSAYSQVDQSIWTVVTKIEANQYNINVPEKWKKVTITDGSGMDYKFDASGVGIPAMVNNSPIYCNVSIAKMTGKKIEYAIEQSLTEFTAFYDRVTEPGYNYDTSNATIKTGEVGKVLHTRYYRRSKVSNFSKYYMCIYDPKLNNTFVLSLQFQYKDPSYEIERSARFTDYAQQIFAHFEFRQ